MSAFRRIGVYLGLAEEDEYADGAEYAPVNGAREYSEPQHYSRRDTRDLESRREIELAAAQRGAGYDTHGYDTHGYDSGYDTGRDLDAAGDLHPSEVDRYHDYDVNYEPSPRQRITTLHPRTYNEAKTIGQQFRGGTPVIMNLSEMDDSDAKRLVDFAAGLTFGLHGSIERVTPRVFLLSPKNITVTAADKARIAEGGFYNQS